LTPGRLIRCWCFRCLFRIGAFLLMFLVSPYRASHFCRTKVTKTLRPIIRPWLRQGSLTPSPLQRPAAKGHPWPIAALATSMSLDLFHDDSVRPPGRALHAPEPTVTRRYATCLMVAAVGRTQERQRTVRRAMPSSAQQSTFHTPNGALVQSGRRPNTSQHKPTHKLASLVSRLTFPRFRKEPEKAVPRAALPSNQHRSDRHCSANTSSNRSFIALNARAATTGWYWLRPGILALGLVNECTAPP
jgi:hypothetical protein